MQSQSRNQQRARDAAIAALGFKGFNPDQLKAVGIFDMNCLIPKAPFIDEFRQIRDARDLAYLQFDFLTGDKLSHYLARIPQEVMWKEKYHNLVVTTGRNDMLDKWLQGSGYTALWYLGLISSVGWSAVAAGDTMASHAGWTEFAGYSNANRPTTAWSAAAGGAKSLSAGLVFNINASGTVKGSFMSSNNTKSGTTGILASAGLFVGGDQPVVDTNTLTANYSLSLT